LEGVVWCWAKRMKEKKSVNEKRGEGDNIYFGGKVPLLIIFFDKTY
jgi:hypothetical protein